MNTELRQLLAQRRREAMAQQSACVTLDDGTLICVGEYGWFEVPPSTPPAPAARDTG